MKLEASLAGPQRRPQESRRVGDVHKAFGDCSPARFGPADNEPQSRLERQGGVALLR